MGKFITSFRHLKTIITHKYWVGRYCFMCGLYYQGIVHDLSKFSPTEFLESIEYYTGINSPIENAKKAKGYSLAWLHHRGRNMHHHVYWTDNYDEGTTYIKIPFKYVLEMVCDFLGAGRAYSKETFTIEREYEWWQTKRQIMFIHPDSKRVIDILFDKMKSDGIEQVLKDRKLIKSLETTYNALGERKPCSRCHNTMCNDCSEKWRIRNEPN